MTQELVKASGALAISSDQTMFDDFQLAALKQLGLENATNGDLAVFLHQCQKLDVDPFSKEIYMIARQGKQTIQMGIDGFRKIAERSSRYLGQTKTEWCGKDGVWKNVWLDSEPPKAARVGIKKSGWDEPLYGIAHWDEYAPFFKGELSLMWKQRPAGQLAKCAESLGFRKAFPNVLSGVYSDDEMAHLDSVEADQPVKKDPVMTKSEPVEQAVIYLTDDEINAASLAFDNIEQFNDRISLKAWSESPAIVPMLFIPVNSKGLTIHQGVLDRAFYLKEQEAKNGK